MAGEFYPTYGTSFQLCSFYLVTAERVTWIIMAGGRNFAAHVNGAGAT
jgi:hypothetical protein